jgi:hypothetical protein
MPSQRTLPFASPILVGVFGVLFCLTAYTRLNQNDQMYAVAPIFLSDAKLYSELPFVQAPLSIYLYSAIHYLTDPSIYYLTLRTLSVLLTVFALRLTYLTAKWIGGMQSAYLTVLLCLSSIYVGSVSWEIGNYALALFLLLCATCIYFKNDEVSPRHAGWIGFCIGLAASAKLNFALFAFPFGYFLARRYGLKSRQTSYFVCLGLIGSILIWQYLVLDPQAFWFWNIDFHYLVNLHRNLTALDSINLIADESLRFVNRMWLAIGLSIAGLIAWRRHSPCQRQQHELAVLAAVSYIGAVIPKYLATQYLSPLAVYLCILGPISLSQIKTVQTRQQLVILAVFLISCLPFFATNALTIRHFSNGRDSISEVSRISHQIETITRSHFTDRRCRPVGISLSPTFFLSTPVAIQQFAATGTFVPQIKEQLDSFAPSFSHHADLDLELQRSPPTVILVGYFPEKAPEMQLRDYAIKNDFAEFQIGTIGGNRRLKLFLKRGCGDA